ARTASARHTPAARQHEQHLVVTVLPVLFAGCIEAEDALLELLAAAFGAEELRFARLDTPLHGGPAYLREPAESRYDRPLDLPLRPTGTTARRLIERNQKEGTECRGGLLA